MLFLSRFVEAGFLGWSPAFFLCIETQLKDLIFRSLPFIRDNIVIASRAEECRTTWMSSRPKGEISFLQAEFWW